LDDAYHYCIAVSDGEGHVINSIHKRRELFVKKCKSTYPRLKAGLFDTGESASGS
jgi:hypothetical protein